MAPPRRRKLFQGILCQAERVSQDRLYEISSARTLWQIVQQSSFNLKRRLQEIRQICSRLSWSRCGQEGFLIWGRASPKVSQQSDVLPRKPFINSHEALVRNDISLRPAPDPPPSVSVQDMNLEEPLLHQFSGEPVQDMNLEEPLLHQFSGEPQIVTCLAISQLTSDTSTAPRLLPCRLSPTQSLQLRPTISKVRTSLS